MIADSLQVGDLCVMTQSRRFDVLNGYRHTFPAETELEIRKIGAGKVLMRGEERSFWVDKFDFEERPLGDGVLPPLIVPIDRSDPKYRALGQMPSPDHLSPADPRLDWFWRDVAEFARKRGFCSEYDKIADQFGVPGREREFTVKRELSGLTVTTKVTARSQAEADATVDAALKSA